MKSPATPAGGSTRSRLTGRILLALSLTAGLLGFGVTTAAAPAEAASGQLNIVAAHSGQCVEVASAADGEAVRQQRCSDNPRALWSIRASPVARDAYQIVNASTGKCLRVKDSSAAAGAAVQQGACDRSAGASFRMGDAGEAALLKPLTSSPAKCVEVRRSSLAEGAPLRQWNCTGQPGAGFIQRSQPARDTTIVNVNSGKCLAIRDSDAGDGARVVQSRCTGDPDQRWYVTPALGVSVALRNAATGKCVQIEQASYDDGARAVQSSCLVSRPQSWVTEQMGDGSTRLVNLHSMKYLGIAGESEADGAEAHQGPDTYGPAQRWRLSL
ncbi:RICIN domain-containing protein [Streptomyces katsurahamanus]|uniref:Ricin B lectin domain-containing protein n=1 Tax=Streptomyces katsurahamanus TaxID=2577098 RepID=A0ABW9NLX6_9ACTN|nr:RICIN domain-containing protein [Streptomyces katsurahamanus]MQS34262.1 hypothetical protein [Streptomyces katsurahamanus]